ncbi:MAG: carboxypeptidase-like regulatory domain-containing protein [Bacillati bacterium ANGP1]|uniref:Carboxypeptidase-like regulatory domain-containing protein n=1 Tax=Candidatus Segetimicrobium genomatis TaxID=2569760 RepID=A0A537IJQ8_9BACT|nr:MAG: carboxypeptidase-like regulatory domain-containing protein [Terrabacteria group bacterium ANGP1]
MRCSSVLCSLALTFGIIGPGSLTAQGGSVAGTVVNRATGAPVAAAQVTVAGTTLRAFTDASGRFALNEVPGAAAVLQVRMIGFRARTDTVNVGDTNLRIALDQKALELEQVVVTGTAAATAQREIGNAVSRLTQRARQCAGPSALSVLMS